MMMSRKMIKRKERLQWDFEMKAGEVASNMDVLDAIHFKPALGTIHIKEGETFTATYTLHLDYIGQVLKDLTALKELQKRGICLSVNEKELNHGRCLIRDVFKAIDNIQVKP